MNRCILLLIALLCVRCAWADVYAKEDPDGTLILTDAPMEDGFERVIEGPKEATSASGRGLTNRATALQHAPLIERAARVSGVDAALLHAVIRTESAYNARALSPKGAAGLMQLMPATARRYGVSDRFDPDQNVLGGALYLRDLLARFNGELDLALAAYNAGEGAVQKYGNRIPPYDETRRYVPRVLHNYRSLQ